MRHPAGTGHHHFHVLGIGFNRQFQSLAELEPLDQIAYYLGYKDPDYLSRVFKQRVSISLGEYRKQVLL